ncbi:MAG: hypothetical protein AB7Q29_17550 [Vicinamibacterales bacterium]
MKTCRDVATLLSASAMDDAPLRTRLGVWLHLSMCRHCRAFKRQLESLARATRSLAISRDAELPEDFEATLTERLGHGPSPFGRKPSP